MGRSRRRIAGLNEEQVMHAMGIDDAYRVERVLARGAYGETERVTIEGAGPFIRKKMPTACANRGVWAAIASSPCPRLPQIAATYEMPDCFVAVYDDIPGDTLEHVIASRGALGAEDALQVIQDVCEADAALHQVGVIHRDISPENVILAADGAHLIDFGNARLLQEIDRVEPEKPLGTWGFAAPEQYGFAKTDERSDVYAIGRLLGYLLTGIRPERSEELRFQDALADAERVPAPLRAVVERACAFEPSARFQSVEDMAAALEAIESELSGERGVAKVESPASMQRRDNVPSEGVTADPAAEQTSGSASDAPQWESVHRGRRPWAWMMAAVVVAVLAGGAVWLGTRGAEPEPTPEAQQSQLVEDEPAEDSAAADLGLDDVDDDVDDGSDSGNSIPVSESDVARANRSLELVESGWSVVEGGLVFYGVSFRNTSEDLIIEFPKVLFTGRAEDGSVMFTDHQTLNAIYPGETLTFAGMAGDGVVPAELEIGFGRVKEHAVSKGKGSSSVYEVKGLSSSTDVLGGTVFTGELALTSKGDEASWVSEACVSVILRDEAGDIICGENTFVDMPQIGESAPFEISTLGFPEYTTAEVHAFSW